MVTFDGAVAKVLTDADNFITVQIPESLSAPQSAQLEVVVDGAKSASLPVQISEVAPAIFPTGILNEDFSANSPSNPAAVGSALQILVTGLKKRRTGGGETARPHADADICRTGGGPGGNQLRERGHTRPICRR